MRSSKSMSGGARCGSRSDSPSSMLGYANGVKLSPPLALSRLVLSPVHCIAIQHSPTVPRDRTYTPNAQHCQWDAPPFAILPATHQPPLWIGPIRARRWCPFPRAGRVARRHVTRAPIFIIPDHSASHQTATPPFVCGPQAIDSDGPAAWPREDLGVVGRAIPERQRRAPHAESGTRVRRLFLPLSLDGSFDYHEVEVADGEDGRKTVVCIQSFL